MRAKVLRQFLNGRDIVHEGQEIEVSEARARQLAQNGLITTTVGGTMRSAGAAKAGVSDPTPSPPDGGLTGEETPVSSPRRGRPPRMSHSGSEEDERGF